MYYVKRDKKVCEIHYLVLHTETQQEDSRYVDVEGNFFLKGDKWISAKEMAHDRCATLNAAIAAKAQDTSPCATCKHNTACIGLASDGYSTYNTPIFPSEYGGRNGIPDEILEALKNAEWIPVHDNKTNCEKFVPNE